MRQDEGSPELVCAYIRLMRAELEQLYTDAWEDDPDLADEIVQCPIAHLEEITAYMESTYAVEVGMEWPI